MQGYYCKYSVTSVFTHGSFQTRISSSAQVARDAAQMLDRVMQASITYFLKNPRKGAYGGVKDGIAHWCALLRSVAVGDGRTVAIANDLFGKPGSQEHANFDANDATDDSDADGEDFEGVNGAGKNPAEASSTGEDRVRSSKTSNSTAAQRLCVPTLRARECAAVRLVRIPILCVGSELDEKAASEDIRRIIECGGTPEPPKMLIDRVGELCESGFRLATGSSMSLRAWGLDLLLALIASCGHVPDPELDGHGIMEMCVLGDMHYIWFDSPNVKQ